MSLIRTLIVFLYTLFESKKIISKMQKEGSFAFFGASKSWAKNLLKKAKINVKVGGSSDDNNKSYIIVANHSSYLDIPVLLASLDLNFIIMYKKELENIPIFGKGLQLSPFIDVVRTNPRDAVRSLEKASDMLANNVSVLVFPEGTRTITGSLGKFKKGATRIAYKSKVDILPVRISGTYDIMPKNSLIMLSGELNLDIKPVINYAEYSSLSEDELLENLEKLLEK